MATSKSSITRLPSPQDEFIQPLAQGAATSERERECRDAVTRRQPESFTRRAGTFVRKCWRSMKVMNTAFNQEELCNGARSRERSEERLRDEEAWLRMEDEGCPNDRHPTVFVPTHPWNGERGYIE